MAAESSPLYPSMPGNSLAANPLALDGALQRAWAQQRRAAWQRTQKIAMYPMIFFQFYLAISVAVFAFGPWPWPVTNPLELYTFLLLAHVCLYLGYRTAITRQPRASSIKLRIPMVVAASLICNFVFVPVTYKTRTGATNAGVGTAVEAVGTGLTDPGAQYDEKIVNNATLSEQSTIYDYLVLPFLPLMYLAFPLGIFFWKQMPIFHKTGLVVWLMVDISMWIASGTNKGIADLVLLLPCLLIARKPDLFLRFKSRDVVLILVLGLVGLVGLFTFFSLGMSGRSGGSRDQFFEPGAAISADTESVSLRYLPVAMQGSLASFASYFSQGYYALSLSLHEPFVFCYGVGNSYFLEGLSRHLVVSPIGDDTYPARIELSGWDRNGKWHSIYPWIASDLSFPGTLVFMFFLGRIFAVVWLDVAFARNPIAVCLFPLILTMMIYIPANNQVLGFSTAALPLLTLVPLWLISRVRARGITA